MLGEFIVEVKGKITSQRVFRSLCSLIHSENSFIDGTCSLPKNEKDES
jgi:hypothetical protein